MSEAETIKNSDSPRTQTSLADDFRRLGLEEGMVVIVHSAMSKLGWVNGGPVDGRVISPSFGQPVGIIGPPRTFEIGLKLGF